MRIEAFAIGAILAIVPLQSSPHAAQEPPTARATLNDAKGAAVGTASLRETPNGVLLRLSLSGLPAGTHALHIHQTGKCEAPAFTSAGGHLALTAQEHGFLNAKGPHAGDLPNIHVPADGRLDAEFVIGNVTVSPGSRTLFDDDGSAVVIHAGEDDYRTNPSGGAGDRLACGVIVR